MKTYYFLYQLEEERNDITILWNSHSSISLAAQRIAIIKLRFKPLFRWYTRLWSVYHVLAWICDITILIFISSKFFDKVHYLFSVQCSKQNKMKRNDLCFIFSVKFLLILKNKRNTFTYNITNAKINNNHLHHARIEYEKQTCCQQFSCLGWIC